MEKKIKEIPFGAKDSELYKFEYTIPEGYEARIEDGKVIVKKKESEDERIKNLIYCIVRDRSDVGKLLEANGCPVEKALSWIEKQKEQQPLMRDGEIEDKKRDIVAAIRKYYPTDYAEYLTYFLKGLSPEDNSEDEYGQEMLGIAYKLMYEHIPENFRTQEFWDSLKFMREYTGRVAIIHSYEKPAEGSEDYREEDLRMRFAFYTYKDEDGVLYLSNVFVEEMSRNKGFGTQILKAAEKVAETIGAISIRLKVKQNYPANAWYRKNGYGYMTFEDGYDWLEKTLEYLKPKQEWSEEDEGMLNCIIATLCEESHGGRETNDKMVTWLDNRLKSLRPQPHWKPSVEQMDALARATNRCIGVDDAKILVKLLEQLEKL